MKVSKYSALWVKGNLTLTDERINASKQRSVLWDLLYGSLSIINRKWFKENVIKSIRSWLIRNQIFRFYNEVDTNRHWDASVAHVHKNSIAGDGDRMMLRTTSNVSIYPGADIKRISMRWKIACLLTYLFNWQFFKFTIAHWTISFPQIASIEVKVWFWLKRKQRIPMDNTNNLAKIWLKSWWTVVALTISRSSLRWRVVEWNGE